jgi:hypothetical protein
MDPGLDLMLEIYYQGRNWQAPLAFNNNHISCFCVQMLSALSRSFGSMAQSSVAPTFKAFNIALIQLGGVTANKADNLKHARKMILKAATGDGDSKPKPDVIVLPVCID